MTSSLPCYENRFVLFLDFLGFSDLIERTVVERDQVGAIVSAISHLREVTHESEFFKTKRVTQFSDCLVISYRIDEKSAVFDLLVDIGFVIIDLLQAGFLVRGGVSAGPLFHTTEHLFGPAMIAAYKLESSIARFPRVLVAPEVVNLAMAAPAEHHSGEEELSYVQSLLRRDDDGHHFIPYIAYEDVVAIGMEGDDYPYYLSKVAQILEGGLKHPSSTVLEKYLWLYKHYIAAINLCEATKDRQTEFSALYDGVLALPRFDLEAKMVMSLLEGR